MKIKQQNQIKIFLIEEFGTDNGNILFEKQEEILNELIENTKNKDQQILTLNSMQSVTKKEVEEGTTYLSIMENNLEILKEAL